MAKECVLLLMLFCHVLDDYFLQGILASMKQRDWWKENAPEPLYQNDYKMALLMHSISWATMIMLPVAWYHVFNPTVSFYTVWCVNVILHMCIDDLKANHKVINLITDQSLHLFQIILT